MYINPGGAQHVAKNSQDVGRQTTLSKYAEGRADRCPQMMRDTELFTTHTKTMKTKRWQQEFDMLKSKLSQHQISTNHKTTNRKQSKTDMCNLM